VRTPADSELILARAERAGILSVPIEPRTTVLDVKVEAAKQIGAPGPDSLAIVAGIHARCLDDSENIAGLLRAGSTDFRVVDVPENVEMAEGDEQAIIGIAGEVTDDLRRLWLCCDGNLQIFENTWKSKTL
jgi:hypothetical protein